MINNLFSVKNKVIIITGGAGVLGSVMAKGLAQRGAKIALIDLSEARMEEVVSQVRQNHGEAMGLVSDVLSIKKLEQAREKIMEKWSRIDILVNAAGGNMPGATISPEQTFFDLAYEEFQKVQELNLNGTVLPSMVFGEVMSEQKIGSIINISSMAAERAITRVVGYSAAKAAVSNFTKWLAVEVALKFGDSLRVNAIAPGFFIGEQNRKLLLKEDGTLTERGKTIIANTPMKRFGKAEELLGTLIYLCSDASKFITGTIIPIDGGFSAFSGV